MATMSVVPEVAAIRNNSRLSSMVFAPSSIPQSICECMSTIAWFQGPTYNVAGLIRASATHEVDEEVNGYDQDDDQSSPTDTLIFITLGRLKKGRSAANAAFLMFFHMEPGSIEEPLLPLFKSLDADIQLSGNAIG